MFVVSLSGKRLRKILLIVLVCISVFLVAFGIFFNEKRKQNVINNGQTSMTINSSEKVLQFISSLGWEVDTNPVEIRDVVIPEVFDDIYNSYNQIQISQGFDLQKYAGRKVKRWTYIIRNYPDTKPEEDYIRINVLVCDEKIIGGDVCSIKLDGFMHGFSAQS